MNKSKDIPTVLLSQFIKHALEILKNPLPFHLNNFEKLGDTFRLKLGLKTRIFFSRDAAFAEYVLQKNQKNYTKSKIQTEDLAKYVGKGLLTSEGEHWRKQRKFIQPAFHKKQLEQLLDTVKNAILKEYERIEPDVAVNIFPILNDLLFQTVVKSLFSSAANQEDINQFRYIAEAGQRMMVEELRQPYLGWWFIASGKIEKHIAFTEEAVLF